MMISPPDAAPNGSEHPAVSSCSHETLTLSVMRQRSEFLKAARARRQATTGMVVQVRKRADNEQSASAMRVGYTCSKKVGNAVARNRAKRRLREVARTLLPELGHAGYDYVLIGRRAETADRDFADLLNDFRTALGKLHR